MNQNVLETYRGRGLAGRVGFGARPAVLVVDLILGFTDPEAPLGSDLESVVSATRALLDAMRDAQSPVLFTTTSYGPDLSEAGFFLSKVPSLETLQKGSTAVQLDPRLGRRPAEVLLDKKYASAFFGTALAATLVAQGVDTVIVCGATTSGCVRASVVDAVQHGFRPIVPRECVGDRAKGPHEANLLDIDGKYGDVMPLGDVLEYVATIAAMAEQDRAKE